MPHKCLGDYKYTVWVFSGAMIEMIFKDEKYHFYGVKTIHRWQQGYGIVYDNYGRQQEFKDLKTLKCFIIKSAFLYLIYDYFIYFLSIIIVFICVLKCL
jgi:hypothetical protein